jgi:drug/metabolite transporter (DMT)-like permease
MNAVTWGLAAAFANASQALISTGLARRFPARQLVGVLFVFNCLLLLPFAPFVEWHWSPTIVVYHVVSGGLMVVTALAVWDMFDRGEASSTTTATALSPISAAIGTSLLIPGAFGAGQAVAAVVVVAGVVWALRDAFTGLGRTGTAARVLIAAGGTGTVTVVTRLLSDEGAGLVEIYVVRTALAAMVLLIAIPPRDVPLSSAPALAVRSVAVTLSFVFIILGVQEGSPVVVQTMVALTPMLVLAWESVRLRRRPPPRTLTGAALVVVGVALVAAG